LISAVFSLTWQASQLGLSPRVEIKHTSVATAGQIYLPALNWILMLATIAVVLIFRSSDNLAAAFGLAVSTTMAITTLLFAAFASTRWHWSRLRIGLVAGVFMVADLAFVAANAMKFANGGWLPVAIGIITFLITFAWFTGQRVLRKSRRDRGYSLDALISSLALSPPHRVQGIAVFMMPPSASVPTALLHHLKHNQVLHERVVVLTVIIDEMPRVADNDRMKMEPLEIGFVRIVAHYGYMEEVNVPELLMLASDQTGLTLYDPMTTSFYMGRESLVPPNTGGIALRFLLRLFIWLHKNELDATSHFHIPHNRMVELGTRLDLHLK
jgi:KUP system potassium uptake protein